MTSAAAAASLPLAARLRALANRGLRTMAAALVVAPVLALLFSDHPGRTTVYALSITFTCWLLIDGGRFVATLNRADGWPGWPAMGAILLAGTPLGYMAGVALGNGLTGGDLPGLATLSARQALAVLVLTAVPGLAITWLGYSRGRLAASEALAQKAQREAAESQLRLLQSQLEPHMLFNTLANLRVLIADDPPRAQHMLDRLIGFLRATLGASRVTHQALGAEFALLADYLALMQVRLGDRLVYTLDLPPALAALPVPALLLQPLVENAIRHGIEPKPGGGRIEVRAASSGGVLTLTVHDTGAGLGAAPTSGSRFGLAQLRERLATLYGTRAGVELADAPQGGGAQVTVRLPAEGGGA